MLRPSCDVFLEGAVLVQETVSFSLVLRERRKDVLVLLQV